MKIELKIILDYDDMGYEYTEEEKNELIHALDYFTNNIEVPGFSFTKPEQTYEVKEIK